MENLGKVVTTSPGAVTGQEKAGESKEKDHSETQGPRVGVRLTKEQASLVIRRHNLGNSCKSITYINRGFNNKTYIVQSDEDNEYIIRLCGIHWTRIKTESEVASIIYVTQQRPNLPLPKILGFFSSKEKSGIGNEYMIMKRLPGTPLSDIFPKLSFTNQKKVLDGVALILGELQSLTFSKIGSLQFIPSLGDTFGLGLDLGKISQNDIVVGPGLEAQAGPFSIYLEYLKAALTTELECLKKCPFLLEFEDGDGNSAKFISRIQAFITSICDPETTPLPPSVTNVSFVLTHGDFEPRNLLVDQSTLEISGIVDFEFSGSFPIDEDWFAGFDSFGADTSEKSIFNEEPEDNLSKEALAQVKAYFLQQCLRNNVRIPRDIPGHETRALLYYFKCNICPWWMRENIDPVPQEWYRDRNNARVRVRTVLEMYGH